MMRDVDVIEKPNLDGKREALVLAEDRVGHYPEFREFFIRRFSLNSIGLSTPCYVRAPSGIVYSLVFVGRSGKPFPDGLEVYALVDALEPINEAAVDTDLWAFLRWTIHGVGGEWRVDDLDATGRLYQLPFLSRPG
jgi:hypothetical protein